MSRLSAAPARIDSDLLDDFSNPARQDNYPRSSRAYVRVDISIRAYWHSLFDQVPELLALSGPDGKAIFLPFMEYAREKGLTLNWTYYLSVYEWLLQSQFKDQLNEDLLVKVMSAAAGIWMAHDRDSRRCAIVLGSPLLENAVVVGTKYHSLSTVVIPVDRVEFEEPLPPPSETFGMFFTPKFELDYFPGWQPIPR